MRADETLQPGRDSVREAASFSRQAERGNAGRLVAALLWVIGINTLIVGYAGAN